MQSCVGWAFQMEDRRYQGLEKRNVYVRSWVQSKANVTGAKQVKGTIRKNQRERTRPSWILKVMLENFVLLPLTRSLNSLKVGRVSEGMMWSVSFVCFYLKISFSLRLKSVVDRIMTLQTCPGHNPRSCEYVRSHGRRPQGKESPFPLEARVGKEIDSPLEPPERKASLPAPWF